MASQRQLVEELFEAALSLQPEKRDAFLDKVRSDDPELGRMLAELLMEDARAASFLEHPPFDYFGKTTTNPSLAFSWGNREIIAIQAGGGQLTIGQTLLNRFVVVRFIASGGMGEVYEVEDRLLQSVHVALKTILPHIAGESTLQQRFQREVLLARQVTHPNLCPIYDIFHCEESPYDFLFLTMKLLPGETLATRLRQSVPISIEEGLAILKQMVIGLAAIHAADIIHRDIKTNNIMLDGTGSSVRLYITDFGLARAYESEATFSGKERLSGTPDYMAPELFQGSRPSRATDLFAFGVVLHEIFTGEKPTLVDDEGSVLLSPRLASSNAPSFCVHLITECVSSDPQRRCRAFESALNILDPKTARDLSLYRRNPLWTRRRLIGAAVGAIAFVGGGVWWKWDQFENLLHPLPRKRFVALLNWPETSDSKLTPMLTGVLGAIKNELIRIEAVDHDFFVISPDDVGGHVASATHLKEICDPLGANLALTASGVFDSKHFQLDLRLLDPSSSQPLREKKLTCPVEQITSLPGIAVHAAATLLNLNSQVATDRQIEPGTQSPSAYAAFQSAEASRKKPNDAGLNEAIDSYKQAVEMDPRFALAHAKLAQAYGRLYAMRRDSAALDLAMANSNVALTLNPDLVDGHLARALVLEQTGNEQGALGEISKAFALDPSNPTTLRWQAQIYTRLNRWTDAEATCQRVLKERPNSWTAYNDLGAVFHEQGKYQEAIQAFRSASLAAPGSSIALSNLGGEYLQVGEFDEATKSLKKSIEIDPSFADAVANTSLALRYQGKNDEALAFALKAVELNSVDDANWLELGECYSSLHRQREAKAAYVMAEREAERHLQTDATDGPTWMLLALYEVKSGDSQNAASIIKKAESFGAEDLDSQIYKVRILELLGKREEALEALRVCFQKGATALQVAPFPDLQSLREDPRYLQITRSTPPAIKTN